MKKKELKKALLKANEENRELKSNVERYAIMARTHTQEIERRDAMISKLQAKGRKVNVFNPVRTAANNMDILLIAFSSLTDGIKITADFALDTHDDTMGLFRFHVEFLTLLNLLTAEQEKLEDLYQDLEYERENNE